MTATWGIHNDALAYELLDGNFVSIGWDEVARDLGAVGHDRDQLKAALMEAYPGSKPHAIAAWAGNLHRFLHEMSVGDVVVAPFRPDGTVNIGVVTGDAIDAGGGIVHRRRRPVEWKQVGVPRTTFSQSALYELGSALTLFRIRRHESEFRAALGAPTSPAAVEEAVESVERAAVDEASEEPRASRVLQHTQDFVRGRLLRDLSHQDFEEFTADLFRAMGYEAKATRYSQDGGIDVVAHHDPLGIEPPVLKIQCKHHANVVGAPEVQQLVGSTQGQDELSVFISLGSYSRDAIALERVKSGLRLIGGEELVEMVLAHYNRLSSRWRVLIPLTSVLVVEDSVDH